MYPQNMTVRAQNEADVQARRWSPTALCVLLGSVFFFGSLESAVYGRTPKPDHKSAAYGAHKRNVFDLWLPPNVKVGQRIPDPKSEDPVRRESTRLTCIVAHAGPASFDLELLQKWLGSPSLKEHPGMRPLFGLKDLSELKRPDIQRLVKAASPLTHLTKDDPPVYQVFDRVWSKKSNESFVL